MRVFSEFWKLSVRNNDPKKPKNYKWEMVKRIACFHFQMGIKRNQASAASENFFEKKHWKTIQSKYIN